VSNSAGDLLEHAAQRTLERVGALPTESVTEDMCFRSKLKRTRVGDVPERAAQQGVGAGKAYREYITQRGPMVLGFRQIPLK